MRLPKPFYKLPVTFDVERLREEVAALPETAWARHPNDIAGNTSVRLISVDGGENDDVDGAMRATAHLQRSPYLRQVLASFGVVWSRSRLLRLAPGAVVPEHADINYHWFNRVRLHVPIVTRPEVRFYCDTQSVHMAAGEAWIFDNWRAHRVENFTEQHRVHLVADTSGSAAFWRFVAQSDVPNTPVREHRYDGNQDASPLTERTALASVMVPAEVDLLIGDLRAELAAAPHITDARVRLAHYHALLDSLCRDWRQLYALYGDTSEGWGEFTKLRDSVRSTSRGLGEGLIMRTNGVAAHSVLEGRVLRPMLSLPRSMSDARVHRSKGKIAALESPIFIVAAPRSGSTLLYETLAASSQLCTVGGEAHWLVESIEELRPGSPRVDSNRLDATHATAVIAERICQQIVQRLQDADGRQSLEAQSCRFLEKTPKNALRIPFFERIFPQARYIFLWRDPRENVSSIIEAWRSGQWKTYNGLDGFDGPWSLLLPPGWQRMNGQPLARIAAWQWDQTNRIVLDDLAQMDRSRWTAVRYAELIADPLLNIERLFDFLGLNLDERLRRHLALPLPHARYTLTPPEPEKWRANEAQIAPYLPDLEATWSRLKALQ